MRRWIAALAGLAMLAVGALPAAAEGSGRVTVHTADGRSMPFQVELAQSEAEMAHGLMDRPSLAIDSGMLFDFGTERPVAMWMKNTLIPLDMLFIRADGRIAGIAKRTIPLSLDTIPSPGAVRFVLELNGGTSDRLGIAAGDSVGPFVAAPSGGTFPARR